MQVYRTVAIVDLKSGRIGLTDDQAARRRHNLAEVGPGIYEITGPIQFKAGETFSIGSPNKMLVDKLVPIEVVPEGKAKAKPKAKDQDQESFDL